MTPSKYARVLELFLQLLQAGQLSRKHNSAALSLLRSLLRDESRATGGEHRSDVSRLLRCAAALDVWSTPQKEELEALDWLASANALCTDDNYAFSRVAASVRTAFEQLPLLSDAVEPPDDPQLDAAALDGLSEEEQAEARRYAERAKAAELAAARRAVDTAALRRSSLLRCVETAFASYRWPWAQSTVDILVDAAHAAGSVGKLSAPERARLQVVYDDCRAQRARRRAGGGGGGGPGATSFERGAARFAGAAISVRHSVGSSLGKDGRGDAASRNYQA
jgi:hypothetical protein